MSQGKLTPFPVRQEIRRLRWIEGLPIRAVAKIVGVSRGVVLRYAPREKNLEATSGQNASQEQTE